MSFLTSERLKTFLRYVVTGGTSAVVDLSIFTGEIALHVPIKVAASLSFCVAAAVNYTLTSLFVFRTTRTLRGFALFFAVALLGMAINVSVTVFGAPLIRLGPVLSPVLAKVAGIGTAFLFNFWLNSVFVFGGHGRRLTGAAPR